MNERITELVKILNKNGIEVRIEHDDDKGEFFINLQMSESNPHILMLDGKLKKRTTETTVNLTNDVDLILYDLSVEFEEMMVYTKLGINKNWVNYVNKFHDMEIQYDEYEI